MENAHLALVAAGAWSQDHTHLYVRDLLVDYISSAGGVLAEAGARRDGRLQIVVQSGKTGSQATESRG